MDVKQANVVYHDWEAGSYDDKWSISFDQRCVDYAARIFRLATNGEQVPGEGRTLELGCGTGFFSLNLWQAGLIGEVHVTDISEKMVRVCQANGRAIGCEVHGQQAEAEALPHDDDSFDVVLAHAMIHHVPDVAGALAEARRVLRPGGMLVIAGEPTLLGDFVAGQFKRAARITVRTAAALAGPERVLAEAEPMSEADRRAARLEEVVDQHVFTPGELAELADQAGFERVRTVTDELTASWFGWTTRTVEAMVRPELLPERWPWIAYRTWKALLAVDQRVGRLVPDGLHYNCLLSARAPE